MLLEKCHAREVLTTFRCPFKNKCATEQRLWLFKLATACYTSAALGSNEVHPGGHAIDSQVFLTCVRLDGGAMGVCCTTARDLRERFGTISTWVGSARVWVMRVRVRKGGGDSHRALTCQANAQPAPSSDARTSGW